MQFSDEATFHVSGAVNCRNVRIWGSENPMPMWSTNVTLLKSKTVGPLIFAEETVFGRTYLDMLQLRLMPQLQNIPTFIFHQDGSPADFHYEVRQYSNTVLPGHWIGRPSGSDQPLMLSPRGSLTLCPMIFSGGDMSETGYSSHHCHVTLLT